MPQNRALSDAEILGSDIAYQANQLARATYQDHYGLPITTALYKTADQVSQAWSFLFSKDCDPIFRDSMFRAMALNKYHVQRVCRVRARVARMLTYDVKRCFFVTLTFNEEYLSSTTEQTRRQAVFRLLKPICLDYVANVDYGAEKGREHYHAVCCAAAPTALADEVQRAWASRGFVNVQSVRSDESSPAKLAKYVAKLSNHAIKATGKGVRLIYCRQPALDRFVDLSYNDTAPTRE